MHSNSYLKNLRSNVLEWRSFFLKLSTFGVVFCLVGGMFLAVHFGHNLAGDLLFGLEIGLLSALPVFFLGMCVYGFAFAIVSIFSAAEFSTSHSFRVACFTEIHHPAFLPVPTSPPRTRLA
ncbi:MAG: hypothetical protein PHI29_03535 [Gallionella sp.]|nr:hypothetical protein [Gallionella sp.]